MTTAYDDTAFRSQYEQLMLATQQQLHAPLKQQHIADEEKQQPSLPPHLAFTLSSPTSASFSSPLSSSQSLLSQSAPDGLSSVSCCSSSLLLPHLTSLASSFATHQQHVNTTLQALQAAVAEERREREVEAKRSKREEVNFRRRLQDRLDELRDDCNDRISQFDQQSTPQHPLPPHAIPQSALPAASANAYESLSRELDSLRQQLQTVRADLAALVARSNQQPQSELSTLMRRVEGLEELTALHTATIQQQSDHYTAYRTQELREKEEHRFYADDNRRRDREERDGRERVMRSDMEAELRRLVERMDQRDELDRSREAEREKDRQRHEQDHHEHQAVTAAAAAKDRLRQQERDEQQEKETADRRRREDEQRTAAAADRERQKRLQAEAKAEAEFAALRREQEEIDRQHERAKQEKLRQQEAERQRLDMERQKREQERKSEQEKLQAEEQQKRTEADEVERHRREQEQQLVKERTLAEQQQQQQQQLAAQVTAPVAVAVVSSTTSVPYNLFLRLWNLPLSASGNNNPIAALFLPSTNATSTPPTAATASDEWQYSSQTEWMKDEPHPVFEQALLWDYDGSVQNVKVSVYDVVDENVRDEDRLGSAVIPVHLLMAAASSTSAVARPPSSPQPPADAPVNGLTFRLVHEDAVRQARLGDVILMVECEADQPATPQPQQPANRSDMLLVRLSTIALPLRADGSVPSPIAAAFLESAANGEMAYVDQTEWLKHTKAAAFEQSMELPVGTVEAERVVRLSVYDVDSEEVRDEDRLGHVELTVDELRLLAGGVGREMQLAHEEAVKESRLKASGSRVRVSVETAAEDEVDFDVEERKAGRQTAPPPPDAAGQDEDEVDREVVEEESEEEEEESGKEEEDEQEVDDERQTDDDDVELVVEAANNGHISNSTTNHTEDSSDTSKQLDDTNPSAHTEGNRLVDVAAISQLPPSEQTQTGSSDELKKTVQPVREQEPDEVYSDFGDSSSDDDDDDDEPHLQHDKPLDTHHQPTDTKHGLPLMPQLASELVDEDGPQPNSDETAEAANGQQHREVARHSQVNESNNISGHGSEIEEDIDVEVEFGADEDASHFDLL